MAAANPIVKTTYAKTLIKANLVCTNLGTGANTCENMDWERNKDQEKEEEDDGFFMDFA